MPDIAKLKPHEAASFIKNWCLPHVPNAQVIFDCGGLSGNQSIEFSKAYPHAKVYCFEAHPDHAAVCRANTRKYPNITVIEAALHSTDDQWITFWKTVGNNPGGSSLYKFTDYMRKKRKYRQRPIEVKTLSLDAWRERVGVPYPDIMWVDLQGAEGPMLDGAQRLLCHVKLVHIESHLEPAYEGQTMFDEIAWWLRDAGLKMRRWIKHPSVVNCGDAIFSR